MKHSSIIYLVGVFIFGIFYYKIKSIISNDLILIILSIIYLLLLTLAGYYFDKKTHNNK